VTPEVLMTLRREVRVPKTVWATLWFVVAFWVGGSMPVWYVWFRDGQNVTFDFGTLWAVISHLPDIGLRNFWHRHDRSVGLLLVLLAASGSPLVFCLVTRWPKRSEDAPDYAEGPGGAVADGRTAPPGGVD
jgi:succinate dehydrogenase hydrophobic anchor subunit